VTLLVLTREQVRQVDQIAIDRLGVPSLVLMENAGRGATDVLLQLDSQLENGHGSVAVLCGKGNNAGDGFVVARQLNVRGVAAVVLLLFPPAELTGDARTNYDILVRGGAQVIDLSPFRADPDRLEAELDRHAGRATWLVDALLGTGATGAPREPIATAIRWANAQPCRRLALDVPSGLDCDSGVTSPAAFHAEATCTFVAAKPGLLLPAAAPYVGQVHVVDIGVPPRWVQPSGQNG
jgi:NAD(P)H-hydrate epimerase